MDALFLFDFKKIVCIYIFKTRYIKINSSKFIGGNLKDPIFWENSTLNILDQRKLPLEETYLQINTLEQVEMAITTLAIRGAPNIGLAALYGVYIGIINVKDENLNMSFQKACERISKTRPTAFDLFAAIKRAKLVFENGKTESEKKNNILNEANKLKKELIERSKKIGIHGAKIVPLDAQILTHCNTGTLAAPGDGTALSVIIEANRQEKVKIVYADETRPLLQGSRLTMWELMRRKINSKVIVDSCAGLMMKMGKIDVIFTGADRIAHNGDSANKIGTYMLAVLAKENNIPFYIVAPSNTIDHDTKTGDSIIIEQRSPLEVNNFSNCQSSPDNCEAENYAFDITPNFLITGIITENGIVTPDKIKDYKK